MKPFFLGILNIAVWDYLQTRGTGFADYWKIFDYAYGMARFSLTEPWDNRYDITHNPSNENPAAPWSDPNGNKNNYTVCLDPGPPPAGPTEANKLDIGPATSTWGNYLVFLDYMKDSKWPLQHQLELHMRQICDRPSEGHGGGCQDYSNPVLWQIVEWMRHPRGQVLRDIPLSVLPLVAGSYRLSWTVPDGVESYRIKKYPDKEIVDWLGYDPKSNRFLTDPNTHWNWFAAIEVPAPTPQKPGSTQIMVVSGLDPGHNWNFAMKATVVAGR